MRRAPNEILRYFTDYHLDDVCAFTNAPGRMCQRATFLQGHRFGIQVSGDRLTLSCAQYGRLYAPYRLMALTGNPVVGVGRPRRIERRT